MKKLLFACVIMLMGSCASYEVIDPELGSMSKYSGTPVDVFFANFGQPASSQDLSDGRTVYYWLEDTRNYRLPGYEEWRSIMPTSSGPIVWVSYNGVSARPEHHSEKWGEWGKSWMCQVRIFASPSGTIEQIQAHQNTVDTMQIRACHAIFDT
ncbi:MAG: hypothetical protein ACSHXD_03010 [Marinosulfonomonas sp.]